MVSNPSRVWFEQGRDSLRCRCDGCGAWSSPSPGSALWRGGRGWFLCRGCERRQAVSPRFRCPGCGEVDMHLDAGVVGSLRRRSRAGVACPICGFVD